VSLVAGARETVILGVGILGHLAHYASTRLARLRYPARAASSSGFLLADELLDLRAEDVLLVIVYSETTRETEVSLEHARAVGASVVLVTDRLAEALSGYTAATLVIPTGQSGTFSTQATTLSLLEALVLAVAAHDRARATSSMEALDRLREDLQGKRSPERTRRNKPSPSARRRSPARS
jgi:DNA-binding MurR/RpiR family transcriptional regulator